MTCDNITSHKKEGLRLLSQVVSTLNSIHFGSPQLGHTIKATCAKFFNVGPETCSIFIF